MARDLHDTSLSPAAAAAIRASLDNLGQRLKTVPGPANVQARAFAAILTDPSPDRLKALAEPDKAGRLAPPPGMPIGDGEDCWLCDPGAMAR